MKSSKLSQEKRNQLILVVLVTLIVVAGLYFGLIRRQNDSLARLAQQKAAATKKLQAAHDAIHRAGQIKAELDSTRRSLCLGHELAPPVQGLLQSGDTPV